MTEELRVRSKVNDVGALLADLAARADEESLSLRSETRISAGEKVHFVVQLSDETTVLEGVGRCLGSERNGEAFYVTLDQLELDGRSEIMFERIQLERESRAFGEITTGVVELTDTPAARSKPPPPPPLPRAKPSTAPPAKAKPATVPPKASTPPAKAKPSTPPRPSKPVSAAKAPIASPKKPATPAASKPSERPKVLRSAPPPEKVAARDLATADTEIVRDPSHPPREAATREISVDRTALPVPAELAVRAAALVPRLEEVAHKKLTTHAVLHAAMRIGMAALETQLDPDSWDPADDV